MAFGKGPGGGGASSCTAIKRSFAAKRIASVRPSADATIARPVRAADNVSALSGRKPGAAFNSDSNPPLESSITMFRSAGPPASDNAAVVSAWLALAKAAPSAA